MRQPAPDDDRRPDLLPGGHSVGRVAHPADPRQGHAAAQPGGGQFPRQRFIDQRAGLAPSRPAATVGRLGELGHGHGEGRVAGGGWRVNGGGPLIARRPDAPDEEGGQHTEESDE